MYEIDVPCDLDLELDRIERDILSRALAITDNNKTDAAKILGIKRTRLIFKLKQLGIFVKSKEYQFAATRRQLHRYRESKAQQSPQEE